MNDEIKVMTNAEVHEQFPEIIDKTNQNSNGTSGAGGADGAGGGAGGGANLNKGLGDEMIVAKVTKEGTVIDTAIPPKLGGAGRLLSEPDEVEQLGDKIKREWKKVKIEGERIYDEIIIQNQFVYK